MIRTHELHFARQSRPILHDISLKLEPGTLLGLLGANGVGKSTLLALLAGELRPQSGHVLLDDAPMPYLQPASLARRRALLPQQSQLQFQLLARDIVTMGAYPFPECTPEAIDNYLGEALAKAGAAELAERPYGALSGGEAQRIQLARVILQVLLAAIFLPSFLLLDEPTASQDPRHEQQIMAMLAKLVRQHNLAVVVALHDLNLAARWCDRLVLLHAGHILAQGTPAEVLTSRNLEQAYAAPVTILPHPHDAQRPLVLFS